MDAVVTPLDPTYEILTAADELPDEWLEARGGGQRSATTPTFEDIEAGTLAEIVRTHDVTHRDIRPDNLFWLDGHRVIGDFGIAHHADSAGLTEVGIKAGSWATSHCPAKQPRRCSRSSPALPQDQHRADHQPRRRLLGRGTRRHHRRAAMLDRLLHRSVVLNLDGGSYRLRDHHAKNDALRQATTGTRRPLQ